MALEARYFYITERMPGTSIGVMLALFLHVTFHCYNISIVALQTIL